MYTNSAQSSNHLFQNILKTCTGSKECKDVQSNYLLYKPVTGIDGNNPRREQPPLAFFFSSPVVRSAKKSDLPTEERPVRMAWIFRVAVLTGRLCLRDLRGCLRLRPGRRRLGFHGSPQIRDGLHCIEVLHAASWVQELESSSTSNRTHQATNHTITVHQFHQTESRAVLAGQHDHT